MSAIANRPTLHPPADRTVRRMARWQRGWIVLFALFPYLNALSGSFTWDDISQILGTPVVTGGVDFWRAFSTPLVPGDLFRPLTTFSFALNYAAASDSPMVFHAVNIVLHVAVSLLVYELALRLFADTTLAAIAALLFAVHPVHTEAVTSVVGRAEELAALFGLLALLLFMRMRRSKRIAVRRLLHLLSAAAFGAAVCSKESALAVGLLIFLAGVVLRHGKIGTCLWQEVRELDWFPYFGLAALFLVLRTYVVGGLRGPETITPLDNILAFVPAATRLRSALGVLWDYFALLNFPLQLSNDYSNPQVPVVTSWSTPRTLAGLGLIGAGIIAFGMLRNRALAFAAIFPVAAIAVTSNLLFAIGTAKAERFLYLPSVGWALLVAYGLRQMQLGRRYRSAAWVGFFTLLCAFSARIWIRNWDWRNGATLSLSAVHVSPASAKARFNYGIALLTNGHADGAATQLQIAQQLYADWERPPLFLGNAYEQLSRTEEAIAMYQRSIAIKPQNLPAHLRLCGLLFEQQRYREAAAACRRGLRYAAASPDLMSRYGLSLAALGDHQHAVAVLQRSMSLRPDAQVGQILEGLLQTRHSPGDPG